jgi:hypothetical protein
MSAADQRPAARLLLFAALLLLLGFKLTVLAAFGPTITNDTRDYVGYADQILTGAFRHVDLAADAVLPYLTNESLLTLFRPIGYPAVIAAAKIITPLHWGVAVILFQFAVSLLATAMVYRLARCFGLGRWISLAAAAAYASSLQFVVDQAIVSDSLCATTFTIAACILAELALLRARPRPLLLLGAGVLIAASFLIRDVIAFVSLGLVPLAAVSVLGAKGWPRRAAAFALVFLPLIASYVGYVEWNRARVGAAVVTTIGQWSLLDALVRASRYDPTFFSGDGPIAQTGRRVAKNYSLDESLEATRILHREYGWNAVQTAREAAAAYVRTWVEHPWAMIRHALGFLSESQLHQAVRPTETVRDVLLWNTGSDQEFAREAAVRAGNWWMIPAVIVHRLCEAISTLVFAAFLLITPFRFVREGVTAQTGASAGLWFVYLTCLGLHAAVAVHPRYLLPVLAGSIVVGAANIVWVVTRHRARSAAKRARANGGPAESITAGSR